MYENNIIDNGTRIGSRFSSEIKQLEPFGLQDEIIMNYSIHDILVSCYNKIIFVIRKDIKADFRERYCQVIVGNFFLTL